MILIKSVAILSEQQQQQNIVNMFHKDEKKNEFYQNRHCSKQYLYEKKNILEKKDYISLHESKYLNKKKRRKFQRNITDDNVPTTGQR